MMTERQDQIWDTLVSLDSETLLRAVTDYHGMQILDAGFAEFLIDEGLMEGGPNEEDSKEYPEDGDYIISDSGPLGSRITVGVYYGKWKDGFQRKEFNTEEEAVKAIKEDMGAQGYRPDVWRQDDHGGIALYGMEG
jgi:hypothetical protein